LELLEERLLTGHISEALYGELKAKFEAERDAAPAMEDAPPASESPNEGGPSYACPECGSELDEGAEACPHCGLRMGEGFACPECGAAIERDQRRCSCGAQFTDIEEECQCPMCGTVQDGDADKCASCGAIFEDADETEYVCPECGRTVDEGASECECGAVFDREEHQGTALQCPECHTEVTREDLFCPGCGARFSDA
jgi:DNA-directed RNA polymerase subunit RPC12/RpoP